MGPGVGRQKSEVKNFALPDRRVGWLLGPVD
jgi:hypothetical protein